jgi:hypothetical protein
MRNNITIILLIPTINCFKLFLSRSTSCLFFVKKYCKLIFLYAITNMHVVYFDETKSSKKKEETTILNNFKVFQQS